MKRPELLIASSVVLTLISLMQILMALLFVLAAIQIKHGLPARPGTPPQPAWMPLFVYGMGAVCAVLAVWGIVTALGVYRLRRWGRISILIIGACMAALGFFALVGTLVAAIAVLARSAPAAGVGAPSPVLMKLGFGIIALFYAAIAAVGAFWLVYFNRTPVRVAFAIPDSTPKPPDRRPGLVSVYAVLLFLGAAECVGLLFLPTPALLYGVAFDGWKKVAIYLLLAAIKIAIAVGLWKLAEWARRLALGYLAFSAAMMVQYLARPTLVIRANEAWRSAKHMAPQHLPQHTYELLLRGIFGFALLLMVAFAWMLHYYRGRFAAPAPTATTADV